MRNVMQAALFRSWTYVAVSISWDDICYATRLYNKVVFSYNQTFGIRFGLQDHLAKQRSAPISFPCIYLCLVLYWTYLRLVLG